MIIDIFLIQWGLVEWNGEYWRVNPRYRLSINVEYKEPLKEEPSNLDDTVEENFQEHIEKGLDVQPTKKTNQLKVIYFKMPNSDGTFLLRDANYEDDGRAYFKITYQEDSNKGRIDYISRGLDNRTINRYEAYLKPVCDVINYNDIDNSNKVTQLSSGEVYFTGTSWQIVQDKKITVRFEF